MLDNFSLETLREAGRALVASGADAVVLGCVARLVPVKGVDILVEALGRAMADCPALVVVLVGKGKDRFRTRWGDERDVLLPGGQRFVKRELTDEEEKARRELLFNQTNDKVRKAREAAAQNAR